MAIFIICTKMHFKMRNYFDWNLNRILRTFCKYGIIPNCNHAANVYHLVPAIASFNWLFTNKPENISIVHTEIITTT